jgi:hypothetical protein
VLGTMRIHSEIGTMRIAGGRLAVSALRAILARDSGPSILRRVDSAI